MGFWDAKPDGIVNGDDLLPIDVAPVCLLPDGLAAGMRK